MARRLIWYPLQQAFSVAANVDAVINLLSAMVLDHEFAGGITVTRVVGSVTLTAATDGSKASLAQAILVRHENLPIVSPALISETYQDILWWNAIQLTGHVSETAAGVFQSVGERFFFDIKSQRVMRPQNVLEYLIQNGGDSTITGVINTRALIRLS